MRKLTKILMSLLVVSAITSCQQNTTSEPSSSEDVSTSLEQSSNSIESSTPVDPSSEEISSDVSEETPSVSESEPEQPSESESETPSVSVPEVPSEPSESEPETPSVSDSEPEQPSVSEPSESDPTDEPTGTIKDNYDCITIEEAIEIANKSGSTPSERYYVYGKIESVSNPTYGEMTISDETGSLYVYGSYSADGALRYSEMTEKPVAGDDVVLYGTLKTYNDEPEMASAWIQEFTHKDPVIDPSEYTSVSIEDARDANVDEKLQITGTVASITYAFGMIPSGVYLVDDTSSIYVYSKDVAGQVQVGNTITVAGEKAYYVLDKEQDAANKWNYKGSNQLDNAILVSNDKAINDFPTSWIEKTTVKDIMETPFTEDITNKIYEVNAFVNKVEGTGFVNYYINDYDGATGTYSYSQCSGEDYAWLDAYHGKLVTMYVTAINAKASASSCFYRFVPIKVTNDNATFDATNSAQFIIDYYVANQFTSTTFTANPEIVLATTVNSPLVGLVNIPVTYESSDESLIYFTTNDDNQLVLNASTEKTGKATVTATATVGTLTATTTVEFTVEEAIDYDSFDGVAEAIAASDNTEVTVIGTAGPSLVNQVGFYLIDEDGVIAVKCDENTMALISLGDKVVLTGTRTHYNPEGVIGQSVILDATLVANLYGDNDLSYPIYDDSQTLTDLSKLSVQEDYTTKVYVLDVFVNYVETPYYTSMNITDPNNSSVKLNLYSASAGQYSWLKQYAGQTIKVELALCNWNKKTSYAACVLAVVHEDGSKTYNELNYN